MLFPIYASHCHLLRPRPCPRPAFAVGFMSFVSVLSDTRRQESHVSGCVKHGFIGHTPRIKNECLRGGRDKMARGGKVKFQGNPVSSWSLCDDQGCLKRCECSQTASTLATSQCHSNTTIFRVMLAPTLTLQIHSNTTMSLAMLPAPTLPARLLQHPSANSLASSLGRNNFSFDVANPADVCCADRAAMVQLERPVAAVNLQLRAFLKHERMTVANEFGHYSTPLIHEVRRGGCWCAGWSRPCALTTTPRLLKSLTVHLTKRPL